MVAPCEAGRRPEARSDIYRAGEAAYANCYASRADNGERDGETTDTAQLVFESKDARRIEARVTGPLGRDEFVRSDERLFA